MEEIGKAKIKKKSNILVTRLQTFNLINWLIINAYEYYYKNGICS